MRSDIAPRIGPPPEPLEIEGRPLNVLIQLQGTAAAYVRTAEIKQAYDNIIPKPSPEETPTGRSVPKPFVPKVTGGTPISSGRPLEAYGHYVIDKEIRKRTL